MIGAPQDDREKVNLLISFRNLWNRDGFSKSDPRAFAQILTRDGGWLKLGHTEMIKNNLNPDFVKQIPVTYIFEQKQIIQIHAEDVDDITKSDYIGHAEFQLGQLIGSPGFTMHIEMVNPQHPSKKIGTCIVKAARVLESRQHVKWQIVGSKLADLDTFSKSDPFYKVFRHENQSWVEVYKSKVKKDDLNPKWKPWEMSLANLTLNNMANKIKFEVWDYDDDGKHQIIGEAETTMHEILGGKVQHNLTVKGKSKSRGTLIISSIQLEEQVSFLEYLQGGQTFNMIVAIDFTGSNGLPKEASSLHHLKPGVYNQYQRAIIEVGNILSYYDTDKMIAGYGFGGTPKSGEYAGKVHHCFPLSLNSKVIEHPGVHGLLKVYEWALDNVALAGPTLFQDIMKMAVEYSWNNHKSGNGLYTILLIITDGEIADMPQTIESIVHGAAAPLSVIIVGVGHSEDFKEMRKLDCDKGKLKNSVGKKAERDIVQFVAFKDFGGDAVKLTEAVLAELPKQLIGYKKMYNMKPRPPAQFKLVHA